MNIFVGNLSFDATQGDVKKLFEGFGNVTSVVIVMRKEKKAPKSRGFGFVEMPDEQQALAAMAALNGKEFMGRVLNVNPARPNPTRIGLPIPINPTGVALLIPIKEGAKEGPKTEAQAESELKEKRQPGTYRGGRRTRSYMSRRGLAGMQEEAKPWRRSQDNPMRWRKREDQPRPWQKSPGEHKPWKKAEEGARPWSKSSGESKPWRKSEGGFKPWKKTEGESRPWKRSEKGFKPWKKAEGESKPWKKTGGEIRTWRKSGEESKLWKKPSGEAKPWSKSSERPQKSGFNPSTSLGMVRGNGERSRTKGRRKPGGYKR